MKTLDLFDLSGRSAVVTGGLGRLGPVWTRALLDAGASVALLDLAGIPEPDSISDLRKEFGPNRLRVVEGDVVDRVTLEHAAIEIGSQIGPPEILVNNAGIDTPPSGEAPTFRLPGHDGRDFLRTLEINVLGAFQSAQVFGSSMVEHGRGVIVNIGSLYATVSPDPRLYDFIPVDPPFLKPPGYGASKAALVGLTKYLATHWASAGIRVNALSPGGVDGGQDPEFKRRFADRVPLARLARPEELQAALVFLASDASSYITGTELRVDGGFTAW